MDVTRSQRHFERHAWIEFFSCNRVIKALHKSSRFDMFICSKFRLIFNRNSAPLVFSTAWVDIMRRKEAMIITIALLDITIDGIFNNGSISERGSCESLTKVDPLSLACAPGMTKRCNNHKRCTYSASGVWVTRPNT